MGCLQIEMLTVELLIKRILKEDFPIINCENPASPLAIFLSSHILKQAVAMLCQIIK